MSSTCEHVVLPASAVSVSAVPPRGAVRVQCPCCRLPGHYEPPDTIDGMGCPYCAVQAVPVADLEDQ